MAVQATLAGVYCAAEDPKMALTAATRLGPYEILGLIGAGGMGEVYKAKDTRLDRTVAIKVLPADISSNADRRARFEREAKIIAGLNHPHICTLHDVGEHRGALFLVMEHLDGQTLAERLRKGRLPIDQTLEYGAQIADALSVAHHAGIVHRDLKPANVMVTKSGVKLLDFGLAKLTEHGEQLAAAAAQFVSAPTRSAPLTGEGVIVGTLQYMAPEQIENRPADPRTDVWALGGILYEMVTGKRAFEASSAAGLIGAILEREPVLPSAIQPLIPPALDRMVGRCLAKDREERWQDARDLAVQLRWLASSRDVFGSGGRSATPARRKWHARTLLTVGVLSVGVVVGVTLWRLTTRVSPRSALRMTVATGAPGVETSGAVAVSPDGRLVAFGARDATGWRVYVRRLEQWYAQPLIDIGGTPTSLSFSPDNEWLAVADTSGRRPVLLKIPVGGGAAQLIASVPGGSEIRWIADGRLLVSRDQDGIWAVPAIGGVPQPLVQPQSTGLQGRYGSPEMMPDGRALLFTMLLEGRTTIFACSLSDHKVVKLIDSALRPRYLPETGHLIYQSKGELFAAPFDPTRLQVTGEARVVADRVGNGVTWGSEYDVSRTGVLVYLPPSDQRLVWRSRAGKITALPFKPRRYVYVRLAADARRAVLGVEEGTAHRVYLADLVAGEPLTQLTPGDDDYYPMFMRDGMRVLFTSGQDGRYNIADGSRRVDKVTYSPYWQKATSIWPLGPVLLLNEMHSGQTDILELRTDRPGREPTEFIRTPAAELEGVFSPDGRFVAYSQANLGSDRRDPSAVREEVWVQEYPSGSRTQISVEGGWKPVWNPQGGELFYRSAAGIMHVPIANGVRLAPPTLLFEYRGRASPDWDVTSDGQRFLSTESSAAAEINVLLNWFEELKAKVPGR
jgi:serine/threonine-protein kinase